MIFQHLENFGGFTKVLVIAPQAHFRRCAGPRFPVCPVKRILDKIVILNRGFRGTTFLESLYIQNLACHRYAWEGPHRHDMAFGPESAVAGVVGADTGRFGAQIRV